MIAKNKTRITITLTYEALENLKKHAKNWNQTPSQLIEELYKPEDFDRKYEIATANWLDE